MSKEELAAYLTQEGMRVANLHCSKHRTGFPKKDDLVTWFINQYAKQEGKCHYCKTSIHLIKRLIAEGKLKARKTGYGWRGPMLEIDKKVNDLGYRQDNCVLACYYCNNDKSNIFASQDEYLTTIGKARNIYFHSLA